MSESEMLSLMLAALREIADLAETLESQAIAQDAVSVFEREQERRAVAA